MAASSLTRVLIVDDHPVVISGCRAIFASEKSIRITSADTEKSGYNAYSEGRPDVAIIDINLPDLSGFELLRKIRKYDPSAKIIMLSMNDDPAFVVRAVQLGALGYVSKNDDPRELVRAVKQVVKGRSFVSPRLAKEVTFASASIRANPASRLSQRELEILRLLARGYKIAEVADALDVSYKTIANTTSLLKQKMGAKAHADLIRLAVEAGID